MNLSPEKIFKIVESGVIDDLILSVESIPFFGDPYDNGSFVHDHKDIYSCVFRYDKEMYFFEVSKDYYNNYNLSMVETNTPKSFFEKRILEVFTLYQRDQNINTIINE